MLLVGTFSHTHYLSQLNTKPIIGISRTNTSYISNYCKTFFTLTYLVKLLSFYSTVGRVNAVNNRGESFKGKFYHSLTAWMEQSGSRLSWLHAGHGAGRRQGTV